MFVYSGIPSTLLLFFFFFNDTATTEIYTLSLHDALPISSRCPCTTVLPQPSPLHASSSPNSARRRSEEHTSELQSRLHLVCRLLLEKKKKNNYYRSSVRRQSRCHIRTTHLLLRSVTTTQT